MPSGRRCKPFQRTRRALLHGVLGFFFTLAELRDARRARRREFERGPDGIRF